MELFKRKAKPKTQIQQLYNQFKLINGYTAQFSTYQGGLYELDLIRSSIDITATHTSKLNPVVVTSSKRKSPAIKSIETMLQVSPNGIMTWSQFMYKLVTILEVENNAFILPIYDKGRIVGLYPISSNGSSVIEENGTYWLKYLLDNKYNAIEYEKVGHIRKHYYSKDFFGDSNNALNPTIELIDTQNQGIIEGIKSSANIRFLARLSSVLKPEDVEKERTRLTKDNLGSGNNGGVMIFDNRYADIKDIQSKPYIVDSEQSKQIENNVYNYFHVSESILQNSAKEDEYNSFYEGKIEPIALQVGQVLSRMFFNEDERSKGLRICLESSKLQYASNQTKLNVATSMFDRGVFSINMVNDVFNLPHVENGDKRYIRKEYCNIEDIDEITKGELTNDGTIKTGGNGESESTETSANQES